MQLDFALLADDAFKGEHGKLYVWGEFRYIHTTELPAQHGRFAVVARFIADAVEVQGRKQNAIELEIVDQDGRPTSIPRSPQIPIAFTSYGPAAPSKVEALVVVKLDGLVLTRPADHRIHFIVNGTRCGSVRFFVVVHPPEGGKP